MERNSRLPDCCRSADQNAFLRSLVLYALGVCTFACNSPIGTEDSRTFPPSQFVVDVSSFGANGSDLLDDTDAFSMAINSLPTEGGTVHVPPGTYLLEARAKEVGVAIDLSSLANVKLEGVGMEQTVLRMKPASYRGNAHVVLIVLSSGVTIQDLTIDGNRENVQYSNQQSHGVEVWGSSDLRFERVRFTNLHGDGIRLVGRVTPQAPMTERVVIKDSSFTNNGRSGVSMQRAVREVQILHNTFEGISDQSISSEPSGTLAPTDILMEGNIIRDSHGTTAVALEGISTSDVLNRVVFRGNRVENGQVGFWKADGLLIEGNTLIGNATKSALKVEMNSTNVRIIDNDISGTGANGGLVQIVAQYDALNAFPSNVTLQNNRVRPSEGTGIQIRDALGDVTIEGNEIYGAGSDTGILITNVAIRSSSRRGFAVRSNVLHNFEVGIRLNTRGDGFEDVKIEANSIDHDQNPPTDTIGLHFDKTGAYQAFAVLADNLFGGGVKIPIKNN